ncbi:unnamed protein product [Vitrella brassicaformis CCMP3155]|uniref:Uncharacterized protein n=1 Tax=Vitrella brassicaformis (strain CCMP3155) TaxID=1169540 RepID=A0A0G4ER83_VITBC|nr:unnamed protein product [Vitrella brassicaformis CCMP3155]|eukprot:CEM00758.1 unnamed protein product [Vitrella brassicaformis CCMP3155]
MSCTYWEEGMERRQVIEECIVVEEDPVGADDASRGAVMDLEEPSDPPRDDQEHQSPTNQRPLVVEETIEAEEGAVDGEQQIADEKEEPIDFELAAQDTGKEGAGVEQGGISSRTVIRTVFEGGGLLDEHWRRSVGAISSSYFSSPVTPQPSLNTSDLREQFLPAAGSGGLISDATLANLSLWAVNGSHVSLAGDLSVVAFPPLTDHLAFTIQHVTGQPLSLPPTGGWREQ